MYMYTGNCVKISKAAPTARHSARRHQKSVKKIIEKSSKNPSKIYQNPSKINQKSIKISSWGLLGPKRPQDTPKTPPSPKTGRYIITPPGTILEGFWCHVGPKSHLKAFQKTYKIFIDLEVHLSSIFLDFGRVLEGSWTQVGLQNPLKIGSRC